MHYRKIIEIHAIWLAKFYVLEHIKVIKVDEWILRSNTRVKRHEKIHEFRFAKCYEPRVYRNISHNDIRLRKLLLEIMATK